MVAADRGKRKFAAGALLLLLFLFFSVISVSFLINIIAKESQNKSKSRKSSLGFIVFLLLLYSSTFFGKKKIQDLGLVIIFKHCDASTYISRLL